MERREIGKYTVTIYDTLVADIKCEKARILKMERISLKRDLAKIEKLLQY